MNAVIWIPNVMMGSAREKMDAPVGVDHWQRWVNRANSTESDNVWRASIVIRTDGAPRKGAWPSERVKGNGATLFAVDPASTVALEVNDGAMPMTDVFPKGLAKHALAWMARAQK